MNTLPITSRFLLVQTDDLLVFKELTSVWADGFPVKTLSLKNSPVEVAVSEVNQPSLFASTSVFIITDADTLTVKDYNFLTKALEDNTDVKVLLHAGKKVRKAVADTATAHPLWENIVLLPPKNNRDMLNRLTLYADLGKLDISAENIKQIAQTSGTDLYAAYSMVKSLNIILSAGYSIEPWILNDLAGLAKNENSDMFSIIQQAASGSLDSAAWIAIQAGRFGGANTYNWVYETRKKSATLSTYAAAASIAAKLQHKV